MNWFYNLKIRAKLLIGFCFISAITTFIGYFTITNMKYMDDRDTRLYKNMAIPTYEIARVSIAFQRIRVNTRDVVSANDSKDIEEFVKIMKDLIDSINKYSYSFEKTILSDAVRNSFAEFNNAFVKYNPFIDQLIVLAKANRDQEALTLLDGEMKNVAKNVQDGLNKLLEMKIEGAQNLSDENSEVTNSVFRTTLIVIIFGVFISIGMGIFISRIISKPLTKGVEMMLELSKGHLDMRLKMETKDEVGILSQTMDKFADDLQNNVVANMKKIAAGDVNLTINVKDNKDEISPALKLIVESLQGLISESKLLTKAAVEGKLSTRGNADKFSGGYREIVSGVNSCLDAVIGPLNVAAEYVDRISKGDIPKKITDPYNGDFNEIKNNLNNCIDNITALVTDANKLFFAAVEGKLSKRADASKHQGNYRKIIEGVNSCLDAVIGPLNVAAEYVDRISKGDIPKNITDNYNGDFNELKNNLNCCIDNVEALVSDAKMLGKAATEGKLNTRADASKHQGDYRKIIESVNACLDSVIGPLKQAEEVMRKLNTYNRNLLEVNLDPLVTIDYEGKISDVNNATELITGYSRGELIGTDFSNYFTQPELARKSYQQVFETGSVHDYQLEICHRDGHITSVLYNASVFLDENGDVLGVFAAARDITERKRMEEELRESEEKLSTLFNSMTEMVVINDLVFSEQGEATNYRITDCNNAFTNITGIKKLDAVGKLATEVYQVKPAPYLDEFSRVALTGEHYEYTTYFQPMDKHFSISVVSPKKNQFATITTDVTSIKQIQEVITAKNKELENYLYIASHDLRSPLVNIQGFSQRLQKQVDSIKDILEGCQIDTEKKINLEKITNEGISKTLNFVFSNVTKMDTLINGLLQISRTGRIKMSIKKIDMNDIIRTIIDANNYRIAELSARFVVEDLDYCFGDENLLNQLFSNIISNALKYRDKSRQLVIEIASKTQYSKVIYSVKDTGIGLAPRHLEKIWDVFYRVDSGSAITGEGLGLNIVKRIAEKHKGKVWAESEEGKGSIFYIELQKNEFQE